MEEVKKEEKWRVIKRGKGSKWREKLCWLNEEGEEKSGG